jgi:hypothetical protein
VNTFKGLCLVYDLVVEWCLVLLPEYAVFALSPQLAADNFQPIHKLSFCHALDDTHIRMAKSWMPGLEVGGLASVASRNRRDNTPIVSSIDHIHLVQSSAADFSCNSSVRNYLSVLIYD